MESIFLIDTHPERSLLLFRYLKDFFDVHLVSSTEMLESALNVQPKVFIISDTGYTPQLIQRIRESDFFMSGVISLSDSQEFLSHGADVHLNFNQLDKIKLSTEALIRRINGFDEFQRDFQVGEYLIKPEFKIALYQNEEIPLNQTQLQILKCFHLNPERLLNREFLRTRIWRDKDISPRSIDAHISKLKKTLPLLEASLNSVYGQGYFYKAS